MSVRNESGHTVQPESHRRRTTHGFFGGLFIGGALGVLLTMTLGAFAHFDGPRAARFGALDPEVAMERAELVIDFALGYVDATEAQRAEVTRIAQAAIQDFQSSLAEHGSAHEALREILAQPVVDRAALETLRAERLRQTDETSRRIVQTLADAADVLTQEQRVELLALGERFRR